MLTSEEKTGIAQAIQDDIFRKMSVEKKIRLASDFSSFCLKLNRLNKHGNRKSFDKNSKHFT